MTQGGGTLVLSDRDVAALVSMPDAIDCVARAFSLEAGARRTPRTQLRWPSGMMNVMPAVYASAGRFGVKTSFRVRGSGSSHVLLYDEAEARLLALIESNHLSRMRTGAATAIATRALARPEAAVLAVIGAGALVPQQVEAIQCVRPLSRAVLWSRGAGRAAETARLLSARRAIPVTLAASARDCLEQADIVLTATTSTAPVIRRDWLCPGVHINAVGANALDRRELDDETVLAADIVAVDDLDQARLEASELVDLAARGALDWDAVADMPALVEGRVRRVSPGQTTLFKSLGIALEDIALASLVYERAVS